MPPSKDLTRLRHQFYDKYRVAFMPWQENDTGPCSAADGRKIEPDERRKPPSPWRAVYGGFTRPAYTLSGADGLQPNDPNLKSLSYTSRPLSSKRWSTGSSKYCSRANCKSSRLQGSIIRHRWVGAVLHLLTLFHSMLSILFAEPKPVPNPHEVGLAYPRQHHSPGIKSLIISTT